MNVPVPVSKLLEFIPHRPPMVWVDEVLEFSTTAGRTLTVIKNGAHYLDDVGQVRPSSCLEFMAQSYGYISVCARAKSNDPVKTAPKRAFLAAFNDARLASTAIFSQLRPGDQLVTELTGIRAMGPIILFAGQVTRGSDLLCSARMKVFSE